ncbi:MAG: ATP synthase F1 subunit epsilon [Patescibacteria group bacterium]
MDNKTIQFEIVTPERQVLKEEITQVTLPTKQGEVTILPGHVPLVASLDAGVIEIAKKDGYHDIMSLSGGFVEVLKDKVVILADIAERAEEIDVEKAEEARKRAEEEKQNLRHSDKERYAYIVSKLSKELARTRAARRWKDINRYE